MPGVHAILGVRGYGKSRLARAIVACEKRLLVVDTLGEHGALGDVVGVAEVQARLSAYPKSFRLIFRPRNA